MRTSEQSSSLDFPAARPFGFRPWVRRAGLSIVGVAAVGGLALAASLLLSPAARYGWFGEPFVWIYIGTLAAGGLKIVWGTLAPVATVSDEAIMVSPLHQLRSHTIPWSAIRGTEQMIGGDRLIIFYDLGRGARFAALNLNLVKGRRDFLEMLESRLKAHGFVERTEGRSRYLARGLPP
jgi:hypothetical protein